MRFSKLWIIPTLFATMQLLGDSCLEGECGDNKVCGKVELSGVYLHVDFLDKGKTVDRMDLPAVKGDACWAFWKGLTIRPTVMWGRNDKDLITVGAGLGQIIPIGKCLYVTPLVGLNYTHIKTEVAFPPLGLTGLTQRFRSYAPYIGIEATWNFLKNWRTTGQIQFAWTRNRTTISKLIKTKEWSRGFNYGLQLERDINNCWSVNIGGAYNSSMSHEKRGVRGYGFKLGLARWF